MFQTLKMLSYLGTQRKRLDQKFNEKIEQISADLSIDLLDDQVKQSSPLFEPNFDFVNFHDSFVHYTTKRVRFNDMAGL